MTQTSHPQIIRLDDIAPQAWRNGGGQTRELLRWPADPNTPWQMRISVADIESDGPFSAFTNVGRWFAVMEGVGVTLCFANEEKRLLKSGAPLYFDGGVPPDCKLIDGRTRDLNLMLHLGTGKMQSAFDRLAWRSSAIQCGLFTTVAGYLHGGTKHVGPIAAHSLVWFDKAPSASIFFEALENATQPATQPIGWWMSFTPEAQTP